MARRPFFSGNYGSALGSTAQAADIIARAGQQRGQALANMGAQIGGMIQQYGLNKEKQKENKATIKSSIGILERMKKLDPENEPQYMMQIEQLNNEDMGLGMRAKLADKTLQGLSITSRLQSEILNAKGQEQNLKIAEENQKIKSDAANAKEKAYKSIDAQIDQIEKDILNGMSYEDLPPYSKSLLANQNLIKNRQIPLEDLVYNPREELDEKTAQLNFKLLQGKMKQQDAVIKKTGVETAAIQQDIDESKRLSEIGSMFDTKEEAEEYAQSLPTGFKVTKLVPNKTAGGFDVELSYEKSAEEDIPSVPGFPNYKIIGGFVYEGDPKTQKLKKVQPEDYAKEPKRLSLIYNILNSPDVQGYRNAMILTKERDEENGEITFVDKETNEDRTIKINPFIEKRIKELEKIEQLLNDQVQRVDLDLTAP